MERLENCEVHSRKKDLYYIKIVKNEKCDGCKACGFGRKNFLIVPAVAETDCKVGDKVTVAMPACNVKHSYIYLCLLPLLGMFIGLMIPYGYGEKFMLIGGIIGFLICLPIIYLLERLFRRKKKYLPTIIEKTSDTEE